MSLAKQAVISAPVRTPIGTYAGTLKSTPATDLGATAIRAVLSRSGLDPAQVDGLNIGNVIQAGNRMNPARQAAIGGGVKPRRRCRRVYGVRDGAEAPSP